MIILEQIHRHFSLLISHLTVCLIAWKLHLSLVSLKMIRLVLVRVYRCFKSFKISISFSFFSVAVVFFYFSLWGKTNVRWMEKKIQGSVRVMKHLRIGEWKISSCVDFFFFFKYVRWTSALLNILFFFFFLLKLNVDVRVDVRCFNVLIAFEFHVVFFFSFFVDVASCLRVVFQQINLSKSCCGRWACFITYISFSIQQILRPSWYSKKSTGTIPDFTDVQKCDEVGRFDNLRAFLFGNYIWSYIRSLSGWWSERE